MENILVDIRNENKFIKNIFKDKDLVSIDEILDTLTEQQDEIEELEEKIEDIEEDIKENYRPISKAEQYGVSDRDFI